MTAHAFRIAKEKWAHKHAHWHDVMASACEQCGRNQLPMLYPMLSFNDHASLKHHHGQHWVCSPHASIGIQAMHNQQPQASAYSIWIGSEGGLSLEEEHLLKEHGWDTIGLGQRILRAETAALAALSVLLLP
jgi:16S rRNA (uracil1498-N3)-methyltransferase